MARAASKDIVGGITTFLTMSYIIFVNPAILSTKGTGMPFDGVLTSTVLICCLATLLMGLYAKLPFALAPGMGLNAFFTYTLIFGKGLSWQVALGCVFWSGILFVLISLTPLREKVANAIPKELRIGAAVGIGLLLTFIGLKNGGFIRPSPATFVQFAGLSQTLYLSALGIFIIVWTHRRFPSIAFLTAILSVTLLSIFLGATQLPRNYFGSPSFTTAFKLDMMGALQISLLPTLLTLIFTDLFDSLSTFLGVAHATGMTNKRGEPKRLKQALLVDAIGTVASGLLGTSPATTYVESAAGIQAGARTGKASVVTAVCFLPCLFVAPLVGIVPAAATAPVLIVVGALLCRSITELDWSRLDRVLPAYLTLILIPLTFSITQGILWGFISHVVISVTLNQKERLNPTLIGLAILSAGLLYLES